MKNNYTGRLPKARTSNLIIKELANETLIYDLTSDKAHCLNSTAAAVWKNCDGSKSIGEINASLSSELGMSINHEVVRLALDQLNEFHLLDDALQAIGGRSRISRRQIIRAAGVAAIALPTIVSIAAPTPAMAATCIPAGTGPCTPSTNCCSGVGNCNAGLNKCK
jgi:hypothetical protein